MTTGKDNPANRDKVVCIPSNPLRTCFMMMVDTGGGGDDKAQQHAGNHGHGQGALSYAGLVAGKQPNGRKKLNILDIMLERRDNTVNFNLKRDELAKLLFKKMKLDSKSILKIDTSGYGKIHVEFKDNIQIEGLLISLHLILGITFG